MSYDLELLDPKTKEVILLPEPHQLRGGMYAIRGTRGACLNVTFNYSSHFYRALDAKKGIRALYGLTGRDSLALIDSATAKLGDDVSEDYWEPTEGNAKRALQNLRVLAAACPDGVWNGD